MDARKEYESRLASWRQKADHEERWHRRTGNLRLLFVLAMLFGAVLLHNTIPVAFLLPGLIAGLFLSGMVHDRILERRDDARRLVSFYERGLARLDDRWSGTGSPGTEFLDSQHPYAIDLDLFGTGGLFEWVNTTQTQAGRTTLAKWLLHGADDREVAARQAAVREMGPNVALRQALAVRTAEARAHIPTHALLAWVARPVPLAGRVVRLTAFCLPLMTWGLLLADERQLFSLALCAQLGFANFHRRRTLDAIETMKLSARELHWLSELLGCLEAEKFEAARLRELQEKWKPGGVPASASMKRLAVLAEWMDSNDNKVLAVLGPFFLLKTQFAFALAAWRARHGPMLQDCLKALGEMEALSAFAGYSFEHPADVFPELIQSDAPLIEAQGLAHPLIAESVAVRNDLRLASDQPLHVISGSNMSGKSTWLRAIGCNLVLALAGAPVRARAFRMTTLRIGASIRTVDSLQEGVSRFYAEIKRLRQIIQLTDHQEGVVFLIDEVLGGTNSHDRQIGAASIVKALVDRGAIGLITTHDLALTQVVDAVKPPGANFHFEDQLTDGKLRFDYRLKPGVVTKSNALDLMRSIGLDV